MIQIQLTNPETHKSEEECRESQVRRQMQGIPSQRLQRIPSQKTNAGKPKSKTAENPCRECQVKDKCRDSNSSRKQMIYMAIEFIYNIFALLEYKNLLVRALETGGQPVLQSVQINFISTANVHKYPNLSFVFILKLGSLHSTLNWDSLYSVLAI